MKMILDERSSIHPCSSPEPLPGTSRVAALVAVLRAARGAGLLPQVGTFGFTGFSAMLQASLPSERGLRAFGAFRCARLEPFGPHPVM